MEELIADSEFGSNLKVRWKPGQDFAKEGEVKGDIVSIYSESEDTALKTLRHEFIDSIFFHGIEPYRDMVNLQRVVINSMLKYIEDDAYAKKEQAVEALVRLLEAQARRDKAE